MRLTLGKVLYQKRKELTLTQSQFASKIGISTREYVDLENNKRKPSNDTLKKLVEKLYLDPKSISELL